MHLSIRTITNSVAYRSRHVAALRCGIVQGRVTPAVANVDIAVVHLDQVINANAALGRNGDMQRPVACRIAGARTERRVEYQAARVSSSDGFTGADRTVLSCFHNAVRSCYQTKANVPTADAASSNALAKRRDIADIFKNNNAVKSRQERRFKGQSHKADRLMCCVAPSGFYT